MLEKNIKVCGICDENLSGSIYFYDLCISNGIKPLIGLSIKIGEFEVLIYAKNYDGYKNLIKINSLKQEKLIELDDLEEYLDNVLVILVYSRLAQGMINLIPTLTLVKSL